MKTLLVIHSSGRITRSITRRLTARFVDAWQTRFPDGRIVQRDLTQQPPPVVNEQWIAAAFTRPERRTSATAAALQVSETLIEELIAADAVVIGAPIYNFGLPAQLKAYVDQIVRVRRTFSFDADAEEPYQPLLSDRPVIVITSAGDGSLLPGGPLEHLNHLEPHLRTVFSLIGFKSISFVRVGYEEFGDDRFRHSLATAEADIDRLVTDLAKLSVPDTPGNEVLVSTGQPQTEEAEACLASKR